ncbi:MAG: TAXI family TRAP transporter solute-binding subunit [Geminicoccaceae bacterium]|nr:TAXI family TRAP transporter solute-binding subunit [Geminicoccaceae bacterium]
MPTRCYTFHEDCALEARQVDISGRNSVRIQYLLAGSAILLAAGTAEAESIRLMTGPQGGSWYPLGGAIKNIVESNVEGSSVQVLPGAGIANVKGVQAGKADVGFANSVSTVDGVNGNPPFDEPADNVCNVATLYPQYFQVIVLADSGLETPADFNGKRLAAQPKGNTGEAITRHLLEAYGFSYDTMANVNFGSYTDSVSMMKDGNADIFTLGTTVPAGSVMDLAAARDIRVVPVGDDGLAAMQKLNPGYQRIMVKAGSYPGQEEDVPTIGYATHVIARCDLDAGFVHDMLAQLHANVPELAAIAKAVGGATAESMAAETGVPLHEGARKFYEEQGVL